MTDLREDLKKKPFRFSKNAEDFLTEDAVLLVDTPSSNTYSTLAEIPTDLLKSVQGVSFFATIKALEEDKEINEAKKDVGNVGQFMNYLRVSGSPDNDNVNPDVQRVVLSILHGLHAYYKSLKPDNVPLLNDPLHLRFRSVLDTFDDNALYVQKIEHIFTSLKRRYLNQEESDDEHELTIRSIIEKLKSPATFWKSDYFNQKTGSTPIPEQNIGLDTETVRDFYVARIPLATVVLGRR